MKKEKKKTFFMHHGYFEWLILFFGFTNAPTFYMGHINRLFWDLLNKYVIVSINDILIYNKILKEYHQHL